ncbi:hypothetical protein ABT341_29680, partial [Pseudonocardia alni]
MRVALDALTVPVPPVDAERTRAFYGSRPAGRGPADADELRAVRAARRARRPAAGRRRWSR